MADKSRAEAALTAEEEAYSRKRTRTLPPAKSSIIHISAISRKAVEWDVLSYFWWNLRDHSKNFDQSPELFSEAMSNKVSSRLSSSSAQSALHRFRSGDGPPFVILRNILPVPMGFPKTEYKYRANHGFWHEPVRSVRQRQMRTIDCILGGLMHHLGAVPTHRFTEIKRCSYDLTTRWDIQETFDSPQPDMPLRFHQSTVERPLPKGAARTAHTALFAAYGVIRNPRRIPIFLLPVDAVLEVLRELSGGDVEYERTIKNLKEPWYTKEYPRLSRHSYELDPDRDGEPILVEDGDQTIMSFDSSLVWVTRREEKAGIEAINKLRKAIEIASFGQSYEIKLRRHDVLIVDNLRALVARSEETPSFLDPLSMPLLRDTMRRWLREMHGFAGHE